jgi:hypothetical protein
LTATKANMTLMFMTRNVHGTCSLYAKGFAPPQLRRLFCSMFKPSLCTNHCWQQPRFRTQPTCAAICVMSAMRGLPDPPQPSTRPLSLSTRT